MKAGIALSRRVRAGAALIACVAVAGLIGAGPVSAGVPDNWTPAASMSAGHFFPVSAALAGGGVLVAGGVDTSGNVTNVAEIYDPAADAWTTVAPMTTPRFAAAAIRLANGKVLVVGGSTTTDSSGALDTGEVYDPAANTWTPVANTMSSERAAVPCVALLPNGEVLIAGGVDNTIGSVTTADVYNPASNSFSPTGSMHDPRDLAGVAQLPDGRVLVVGGQDDANNPNQTAEIYSPASGTWSYTANLMSSPRLDPGVAKLPNGKVLVTSGGSSGSNLPGETTTTTTDLFDPVTNAFTPGPPMEVGRVAGGISPLADGRVLVAGGVTSTNGTENVAVDTEIYDPVTNSWSEAGTMPAAAGFATDLLSDGDVLAAGGTSFGANSSGNTQAVLFTPTTKPGGPLAVSATAGNHSAFVTFAPPVSDGGLTIKQYTITASSGQTVTTPDGRTFATVAGLANGKAVTFTVTATNALGTGPASSPSNAVTPTAGSHDKAPKLRIIGLARKMTLADLLSGIRFSVKPSKAVRLHVTLLARASRATIARALNLTLATVSTQMSRRRRQIRLVPARRLVGRPRIARVEVVIVGTDAAGSRTTVSRLITIVAPVGAGRGSAPSGGCDPDHDGDRDACPSMVVDWAREVL